MSPATIIKCPSCGASLTWQPGSQVLSCRFCGAQTPVNQLDLSGETPAPEREPEPLKGYKCEMCGAEIVTGATTAATRCYFCHSPVVLEDRLSADFRPDGVIPFRIEREEAERQFQAYLKAHRFVRHSFFGSALMEDFSGVYYPYWVGDVAGHAVLDGQGKTVSTAVRGNYLYTTTRLFQLHREGELRAKNFIRKALSSVDRQLSDGVHPFDLSDIKPYTPGYLSGFLAEMRDIPKDGPMQEIAQEAQELAGSMMRRGMKYSDVNANVSLQNPAVTMRYVLLPVWVLMYRENGGNQIYSYLMNGQTGKVCGRLPINTGKLMGTAAGIGAAVAGALCAGGAWLW